MNRGEEDYIKAIYKLEGSLDDGVVSNNLLASELGHSAQTVNEMVKKLAKKNMIAYTPYKGSRLTKEGRVIALRIIRSHRLWETFLMEKLDYTWDEVHDEAEKLEHVTSEVLEKRLYRFLGEPKVCPHGNPIPTLEGDVLKVTDINLMEVAEGREYQIIRVVDEYDHLFYLNKIGLELHGIVKVINKDATSELIQLDSNGTIITIGYKVAKSIFVKSNNQ